MERQRSLKNLMASLRERIEMQVEEVEVEGIIWVVRGVGIFVELVEVVVQVVRAVAEVNRGVAEGSCGSQKSSCGSQKSSCGSQQSSCGNQQSWRGTIVLEIVELVQVGAGCWALHHFQMPLRPPLFKRLCGCALEPLRRFSVHTSTIKRAYHIQINIWTCTSFIFMQQTTVTLRHEMRHPIQQWTWKHIEQPKQNMSAQMHSHACTNALTTSYNTSPTTNSFNPSIGNNLSFCFQENTDPYVEHVQKTCVAC